MSKTICLDKSYSTTKLLVQERPIIVNKPEDKLETVLFLPKGEGRIGEGGLRKTGYFKKSYKDKPLISIVTVVLNGEKYLDQTIRSVINQDYDNIEYIVIDGGSEDGTLNIIKQYENRIDYWISEKDKSIYDAMNKGVKLSLGKLIGLLNSDDYYMPNAFSAIVDNYKQINTSIIYGNIHKIDEDNHILMTKKPKSISKIYKSMVIFHPACFVTKQTYLNIGLFDTQFNISSDYDFLVRCYNQDVEFLYVNKTLVSMRIKGISHLNRLIGWKENKKIIGRYKSIWFANWAYYIRVVKNYLLKLAYFFRIRKYY